jgi:RsiW-degrading membrane proteinase PrsW (M82 family)
MRAESTHIVPPTARHASTGIREPQTVNAFIAGLVWLLLMMLVKLFGEDADQSTSILILTASAFLTPLALAAAVLFLWRQEVAGWTLAAAAVLGGTLGVGGGIALTLALPSVAMSFGAPMALAIAVGAGEELAKAGAALLVSWKDEGLRQIDGLVLGTLAGLAFAAVENVIYLSRGSAGDGFAGAYAVLWLRVISNTAHGLWTGSLMEVLVRERRVSLQLSGPVLVAFLTVALLHALWDIGLMTETGEADVPAAAAVLVSLALSAGYYWVRVLDALREPPGKLRTH